MQPLRLYFPSFQATQVVCGVATSYAQEIKKLRNFGLSYITAHFRRTTLKNYPFKITITYYSVSDLFDAVSTLTITAYIVHLLESNSVIQSADYRVVPKVEVKMERVKKPSEEGCEISIEPITVEKSC